jgi:heptosyltransferase-2
VARGARRATPRPRDAAGCERRGPSPTPPGAPARLLVYRPGAIGDFILALPALAALRARFPGAAVTVVGPAAALPLAAPLADVTLAADDPRLTPLFVPGAAALPPDVNATHAVVWAGAAAEPLVANLRAAGATVVHAPARPPAARRQHVADYLVGTLAPLGVPAGRPAVPRVQPGAAARAAAAAFLAAQAEAATSGGRAARVGAPTATRWVALHVGSGSPRKNWPVGGFVAVAAALAARGLRPLLVAGPAEGEAVAEALGALAAWRPALARDWPLDHLAALLGACAGYIGADSGITHLAAAAGAPVVALFGPTDPALWAPRGPRVAVVRHLVPCQPCSWAAMWACPHRACLTALAPHAVVAAALRCFVAERG